MSNRYIMVAAMRILRGDSNLRYNSNIRMWERPCPGRPWFRDLTERYTFHRAVWDAVELCRPRDWHQLVLEFPHKSETDENRLAYTRDERAGLDNRQVVTTIGKYLMRHFDLPDHEIRDIVARHTCADEIKFIYTVDEMVHAVNNGPNSCMKWDDNRTIPCDDGVRRHPYACYDPKYGWHMAIRKDGDEIVGRALCVTDGDAKYFVRSFKKGESYSYSDEKLEAWLKGQGYDHASEYSDGQQLAYYPASAGGFLAPYIDGHESHVSIRGNRLVIDSDGEYECDQTCGTVEDSSLVDCEDCGSMEDENDMFHVGFYDDRRVCGCCRDNYREAVSRTGSIRILHNDDCVYVESNDTYYHNDYLGDNEIVELENGDYETADNCVEVDNEWYHLDDERIVCDHNCDYQLRENCVELADGNFALEDECWQCASSGEWYRTDDVEPVVITAKYHPDNVPEHAEETN